ncbi:hypothetical protein [Methylobacterium gnaphalii]|nr:hypothetical protein [Methylobacterium gnaphalii]GJD69001.1 hypothetical protein MMMDOFMJ_1927 [Methylobacterium gnaphalii]
MTRRPDTLPVAGSLFRAGIGLRIASAVALSTLLWAAILWASA